MRVLRPDAAGIDIGATSIYTALPPDRNQNIREFGTFTRDLHELADWLVEHQITTVAMESTGVYWIPLHQILEKRGIEVFLVNARHVKAVPGRKSDVRDCQWLQYLHSVGLLQASFRPTQEIAAIRSVVRHRDTLVKTASQYIQRMQKSLNQMNLQLHHVISDISGVTGLAIIDAIISGQRDPSQLAKHRDRRIKAPVETVEKSLVGDYRPEHVFTLHQNREAFRFAEAQIVQCDAEIQRMVQLFNSEHNSEQAPTEYEPRQRTNVTKKKLRLRESRDYLIHDEMRQAFGIDLFEIPGFATDIVLTLFTEVGPDFSRFRSETAFASWLCLCPNNEITGGKILRTKTRQTKSRLAKAFRQAAYALTGAKSYYGDLYRRFRSKLGAPKAITAIANRLARLVYHLISTKQEYDESKFAAAEARHNERKIHMLTRKARALGFTLVPTT